MNLEKQPPADNALHTVTRTNKSGAVRKYETKLFRAVKRNKKATTISVEPLAFFEALSHYKTSQKLIALAVRAAYSRLDSTNTWKAGFCKSKQVWALALTILEAAKRNVSLDEYLHAEANNAAWG